MVQACFHLATSRYFIIDDYYFPIYVVKPRSGVEIIQLWHSAGALKKFGLSTEGKPFGPSRDYLKHVNIHGNYTKAFVSSSEVIPYFAEAFNISEERIFPLGVPRTDYFFAEELIEKVQFDFYARFPELVDKKILLYAPTFRGKSHDQAAFELPFDLGYLERELSDEYALIIHLHPYMAADLDLGRDGFAYHMRDTFGIQELLAVTDLLITDYSTVFFDYSLLGRPIIFYPYDLEDYKNSRDFYYSYEDIIPGPMATDTISLVNLVKSGPFDQNRMTNFRNRFFDYQDGRAAERIVENIFSTSSSTSDRHHPNFVE